MKTTILSLFFLLMLFQSKNTFAQIFKPGIIVGAVTSDVIGIDQYDIDFHKAGFTAGGSLNAVLSVKNSLQFEILYTQKGSYQPADSTNGYIFYKLNLNYLEVPLMFKHKITFSIRKKPITNFYLEAGPSYGRLINVKQEGTYNYGSAYQNNFKDDEFAINLGVGCRLAKHLFVNVRYCNSITSVIRQNTGVSTNGFFWYTFNKGDNVLFSFTLRYVFSNPEKEKLKEADF